MMAFMKYTGAKQGTRWVWIAAIWFGLGLFEATQNVVVMRAEGMHHAWLRLFVLLFFSWAPWAVMTPFLMRLYRDHPLLPPRSIRAWAIHFGAWLTMNFFSTGWTALLEERLNPYNPDVAPPSLLHLWQSKFYDQLLSSLVLYYCVLVAGYVLDSRDKAARQQVATAHLAEELSKAELNTLRHQIEPHFLFNVLNAVTGLIRSGKSEAATDMIARLSEFLRHTLHDTARQQLPLDEEMAFLSMYLDLQSVRFGGRLKVVRNIESGLGNALVPSLVLQPIVENAIKHGISQRADGGCIELNARREAELLVLEIYNDGPPLRADHTVSPEAIGLANVRHRLQALHGSKARVVMSDMADQRVCVRLSLPLQETA